MSKTSRKKQRKDKGVQNVGAQPAGQLNAPWISLKSGRIIIGFVSLGMALLTAWQVIPARGVPEGILWGAIFGAMIWLIFEGYYWLNRLLRRPR